MLFKDKVALYIVVIVVGTVFLELAVFILAVFFVFNNTPDTLPFHCIQTLFPILSKRITSSFVIFLQLINSIKCILGH